MGWSLKNMGKGIKDYNYVGVLVGRGNLFR